MDAGHKTQDGQLKSPELRLLATTESLNRKPESLSNPSSDLNCRRHPTWGKNPSCLKSLKPSTSSSWPLQRPSTANPNATPTNMQVVRTLGQFTLIRYVHTMNSLHPKDCIARSSPITSTGTYKITYLLHTPDLLGTVLALLDLFPGLLHLGSESVLQIPANPNPQE